MNNQVDYCCRCGAGSQHAIHTQEPPNDYRGCENLAGTLTIRHLQHVNARRVVRWHPNNGIKDWSALEWAGAMAGEAGEACNAAKKLKRIEGQLANINLEEGRSLTDVENASAAIVDEIADTVIYGVLLAERVGLDLEEAIRIRMKFNWKSEEYGFSERIEAAALVRETPQQEPPTNYNDPRTWAKGTDMPPSQPQSGPLVHELRDWLDRQIINGENIGDIRRACFMPWDGTWNGIVRDETAKRECSGVGAALVRETPQQAKAWILTETWRDGSDHIEGITLDNDAMSRWVHGDMEQGHKRTGLPYKLLPALTPPPPSQPQEPK